MSVVLRRSVSSRLFSGFWLQPVLTTAVVLVVVLDAVVFDLVGPDLEDLLSLVPQFVVVAVWAAGVTAWARADDTGVRWRYFRRHDESWDRVDAVRFGTVITARPGGGTRRAVFVRARGVEHPIVPAYDVPPASLAAFSGGLAALAGRHGVAAETNSPAWDAAALPGAVAGPHLLPGRVVSRSLRRLRLRLTALALLVVAGCAFAGTAGWESPPVAERVVFAVIGVVFVLVGLLLLVAPGD